MVQHINDRFLLGRKRTWQIFAALFALAIILSGILILPKGSAQTESSKDADDLFRQEHWSEARVKYDKLTQQYDRQVPRFRDTGRKAVQASLKLKDWDGALDRVAKLIPRTPIKVDRLWKDEDKERQRQNEVSYLEFVREILDEVAAASPGAAGDFAHRVSDTRIVLDQQLVRYLDPPREHELWGWDNALEEIDWWWADVPEAQEYINSDERYSRWGWRVGIALGTDGKPIFLETPQEYVASLPRAKKLLFALDEIVKLDRSTNRHAAAAALLLRARLMRRLFGPQTDVGWSSAEFYYRYDRRPSFQPSKSAAGIKEIWELGNNQARTNIGEVSRVIDLPESHSPLAILARLERDYPQSDSVAAAIHERGLYYQSRRQFTKALDEYRREIKQFPVHPLSEKARDQIARIEHSDVMLGKTGIYASGIPPKLWFACRNADKVEFKAHRFDLDGWLKANGNENLWSAASGWFEFQRFIGEQAEDNQLRDFKPFVGPGVTNWTQAVARSDRVASHSTAAPLTNPGAYLVEAGIAGSKENSRGLVIVSSIAVVQKPLADRIVLWIVDARSGKPLANQKVQVVEREWSNRRSRTERTLISDQFGVAEYRRDEKAEQHFDGVVVVSAEGRGIAFCNLARYGYGADDATQEFVALTDRPIYRPGSSIHFRIWSRERLERCYVAARAGSKLHVSVEGPHGTIRNLTLETDESGSVSGTFVIGNETPLGEYEIRVQTVPRKEGGRSDEKQACQFRVEEYKAPEFEVTVSPSAEVVRPGERMTVRVAARYYFGTPVADADVQYKILREQLTEVVPLPGEFDWLYGTGYATESTENTLGEGDGEDWVYQARSRPREMIEDGRTRLGADGQAEIHFDPAHFESYADDDWRYIIEVKVRDRARRTVEASGSVTALHHEFQILTRSDRGWYSPGDSIITDICARSANEVPVAATGIANLIRLEAPTAESATGQTRVEQFNISLDADGHHTFNLKAPAPGRYKLEFCAHDSGNREIVGATKFWVYQTGANILRSARPALQIIPDRRTYRVGDTAKLLMVTASPDAQVLLCSSPQDYRIQSVSGGVQIVEIRIAEKAVPDLVYEGTVVWEGAVHTETCRIFVPPVRDLLKLDLTTSKLAYKPGEKGTLQVKATDSEGRPVRGDLALTAFDKAITYIQPESIIGPKSFLAACKSQRIDWWSKPTTTMNSQLFGTSGWFMCPEFYLTDDYVPQMGGMGGAPPTGGDPSDTVSRTAHISSLDAPGSQSGVGSAPKIRSDFSDTALWMPHVHLDESGQATADIKFPESLTTWRFRGYLVTNDTRVGDLTAEVVTSKDLQVRLQRPRFLIEHDEVVLSAIVNNNLKTEKPVTAELIVPAAIFHSDSSDTPDVEGNIRLVSQANIPVRGEHRFNWKLSVVGDGLATVTVKALTDEESDAMRTAIPVRMRGTVVTATQTVAFRGDEKGTKEVDFDVPDDADPRKTRLSVSVSSTAASAAFEAIPYLAGYPYGCVEQTMSRFYPTALASRALKKLRIDIAQLGEGIQTSRTKLYGAPASLPDAAELDRMTEAGLQRLERFQHQDGGWGWWENDESSPYMTAYVLIGLHVAAECGAKVDRYRFDDGLRYLAKLDDHWATRAHQHVAGSWHTKLFVAFALSMNRPGSFEAQDADAKQTIQEQLTKLLDDGFKQRAQLPLYDRLLLAMTLRNRSQKERAVTVLKEVLEQVKLNPELDTAHLPVNSRESWHSWNSEIETNAWLLRAVVAIDQENPLAPKLVNWLARNRKLGRYWRSTQDTALAVTAIAEYLIAAGGNASEQTVVVSIDKGQPHSVRLTADKYLRVETAFEQLASQPLTPGRHRLIVEKLGSGPLHCALHTEYLRTKGLGESHSNGISIARRYFKPEAARNAAVPVRSDRAQSKSGGVSPLPQVLASGDIVAVGDLLDVELTIKSDEDFEYVAFEDMKPAGCEPVQLRSGNTYDNDLWANIELRDDRVVFFASYLSRGTHVLRYKLRAETPGLFHALPTRGFAMYAPEIHTQSDEWKLRIRD